MTDAATLELTADLNRDSDFVDTGEDLSANVKSLDWSLGWTMPYERLAKAAELNAVLDNSTNIYSPEHGSGLTGWKRGRVIRLRLSSTTPSVAIQKHFIGWMTDPAPTPGSFGARECAISADGFLIRTQPKKVAVPIQESKTFDQVVIAILEAANTYPPGFTGKWRLGTPGFSELGRNTVLGAITDFLNADTGITVFNFAADDWTEQTTAYGAFRDMVRREYGRLYVDRAGIIQLWNRHHESKITTVSHTFADTDLKDIGYSHGKDLINDVTVPYRTRRVSATAVTLSTTYRPIKIPASGTKEVTFRYLTSEGANMGGRDLVPPVQTAHFTVSQFENGTGTNFTTSVTTAITLEQATRAVVTYTNSTSPPVDVWIQPGAELIGTKITDFGRQEATSQDSTSLGEFGYQGFIYFGIMDNEADAQGLADYLNFTRNQPRGEIRWIEFDMRKNDTLMTQGLARTIGDRIAVSETQTGASSNSIIIGEAYRFRGKSQICRFYLEPVATTAPWLLGAAGLSELGTSTRLSVF